LKRLSGGTVDRSIDGDPAYACVCHHRFAMMESKSIRRTRDE